MPGGRTRMGEEVRDGPYCDNRGGGDRGGVAPTAVPLRSQAGVHVGTSAPCVNRNIRNFVWYGGVAGDGLRSVGAEHVSQPRACTLSCPAPAINGPGSLGHLTRPAVPLYRTAGPLCMPGLYNAPGRGCPTSLAWPSLCPAPMYAGRCRRGSIMYTNPNYS